MTGKTPVRSIEDVDPSALSYAEIKMLATGDPRIKQKMDLDLQVTKLKMLKSNHLSQQYELEDKIRSYYPNKIKETQLYIDCMNEDLPILQKHPVKEEFFSMTVKGKLYTKRKDAGEAIIKACRSMESIYKPIELGEYRGFPMKLSFDGKDYKVTMKQHLSYTATLSEDIHGNITRINNVLEKIPQSIENHKNNLITLQKELESAKEEGKKPFPHEEELEIKSRELFELNKALEDTEKGVTMQKEEPAVNDSNEPRPTNEKPSIRKALKEYERPKSVSSGKEKEREVIQ